MWAEARSLGQAALGHRGQEKGKDLQEKTPSWQKRVGVGLNRTSTDQSGERNMGAGGRENLGVGVGIKWGERDKLRKLG